MTTITDHGDRTPATWQIPPFEKRAVIARPAKRKSNILLVITTVCAAVVLVSCAVQSYTPSQAGNNGQAHLVVAGQAATRASNLLDGAIAAMPFDEPMIIRGPVVDAKAQVDVIPGQLRLTADDITALQRHDAEVVTAFGKLKAKYDADEMMWVGPRTWRWFKGLGIITIVLIVLAGIVVGGAAIATGGVLPTGTLATCFIASGHIISFGVHAMGLAVGKILTWIVAKFAGLEKDAQGYLQPAANLNAVTRSTAA